MIDSWCQFDKFKPEKIWIEYINKGLNGLNKVETLICNLKQKNTLNFRPYILKYSPKW